MGSLLRGDMIYRKVKLTLGGIEGAMINSTPFSKPWADLVMDHGFGLPLTPILTLITSISFRTSNIK